MVISTKNMHIVPSKMQILRTIAHSRNCAEGIVIEMLHNTTHNYSIEQFWQYSLLSSAQSSLFDVVHWRGGQTTDKVPATSMAIHKVRFSAAPKKVYTKRSLTDGEANSTYNAIQQKLSMQNVFHANMPDLFISRNTYRQHWTVLSFLLGCLSFWLN